MKAGGFGRPLYEPKETHMTTYRVLRQHFGDKHYAKGDTREAQAADVQHLVDAGVLAEAKAEKAEPAPKNKAVKAAPRNKSAD